MHVEMKQFNFEVSMGLYFESKRGILLLNYNNNKEQVYFLCIVVYQDLSQESL